MGCSYNIEFKKVLNNFIFSNNIKDLIIIVPEFKNFRFYFTIHKFFSFLSGFFLWFLGLKDYDDKWSLR